MLRMVPPDEKLTGRNASEVGCYEKDRGGAGSPPAESGTDRHTVNPRRCFVCYYLRRRMA